MAEPEELANVIMGRGPANVRYILEGPSHQNIYTVDFEKRGRGKQNVTFAALVAPFREKPVIPEIILLKSLGTGCGFLVRFQDGSEECFVVGEAGKKLRFGPVETDAAAAYLAVRGGKVKTAAVCKGTFVTYKGTRLFASAVRADAMEISWEDERIAVAAEHFGRLSIHAPFDMASLGPRRGLGTRTSERQDKPSAETVSWNGRTLQFERKDRRAIVTETGALWASIDENVITDKGRPMVVHIHNFSGKKVKGKVRTTLPALNKSFEEDVAIEAGASQRLSFDIQAPLHLPRVDYPVSVVLLPEAKTLLEGSLKVVGRFSARQRVIWKLLPTRAERDADKGITKAKVALRIENRSHEPMNAEAKLALDDVKQTTKQRRVEGLAPFSAETLGFEFEQTGPPRSVTGEMLLRAQGATVKKQLAIDIPLARRFLKAPKIDGQLTEWKSASPLHIGRPEQVVYEKGGGKRAREIAAVAYMGYDENSLYFAADVTDPHVLPPRRRNATPWEATGIELYLDTREAAFHGKGVYNREVFQIYLIPGDGKDIPPHFTRRRFASRGSKVASAITERGYTLEASLPWRNFPWMSLERLKVIGFDVAFNARPADGPRDLQLMWHGTVQNWRDATNFGRMYFERPLPERLTIDTPTASYVKKPPVIDADFNDWPAADVKDRRLRINKPEQTVYDRRVGQRRSARVTADAMVAWDKKNLYLAVDVTDPCLRPADSGRGRPWEGTAVEVYLDARPTDKQGGSTYDSRVLQIFLVPGDNGGEAYLKPLRREKIEASVASKRTDSGYRLEAAIAWKNFPDASPGKLPYIGFDLAVDACGPEGGRDLQLMWHGTGSAWRDPSVFGILRLRRPGN